MLRLSVIGTIFLLQSLIYYLHNLGTDAADGGAVSTKISSNTIKLANKLMAEIQ